MFNMFCKKKTKKKTTRLVAYLFQALKRQGKNKQKTAEDSERTRDYYKILYGTRLLCSPGIIFLWPICKII